MPNYRLGRKPASNAPALRLSRILSGTIPSHPAVADYLHELGGWQMLGNDRWGVCVGVSWATERRLLSRLVGAEIYPNLDQVIEFYKTQNPGFPADDNGMIIQDALDYLRKHGGPDGVKAVAFAKVDKSNLEEVKAALAIFGCLWIGINVQSANMTDFNEGKPWDYHRGSPYEGGHSIIAGGYDSDRVGADVVIETWAEVTGFTDTFWTHNVDEVWAVIWPEHLSNASFLAGIDQAGLRTAYTALTDQPFPVVSPPAPVTPPAPTPDPGAATFHLSPEVAARVATSAARRKVTSDAWIEGRLRAYFEMKQ